MEKLMQNQKVRYGIYFGLAICFLIFLLGILVSLSSCGNPVKKMARIERKYPFYVAEYCGSKIEVKTKDSFIYLKGADLHDTLFTQIDCDSAKERIVRVPKYINRYRVDTFTTVTTIIKKDTFSLGLYKRKAERLDAEMYKVLESKNNAIKWAIIGFAMLAIFVVFHFNQRR